MDIDIEQLRALMAAMADYQMTDLELEKSGERIRLERGSLSGTTMTVTQPNVSAIGGAPSVMPAAPSTPPSSGPSPTPAAVEDEEGITWITSPFVGTYYEAPSPGSKPFVKVGQTIEPGTVLCIVEAMKLMNEIESEISGTIVEIAGTNGKPVEFGDRLFKVKN